MDRPIVARPHSWDEYVKQCHDASQVIACREDLDVPADVIATRAVAIVDAVNARIIANLGVVDARELLPVLVSLHTDPSPGPSTEAEERR